MYNWYLNRGIMKYDQIKELSEEQFRMIDIEIEGRGLVCDIIS